MEDNKINWYKITNEIKKEADRYYDMKMRINIKRSFFDWHEPETSSEKELYKKHEETLKEIARTGKCTCGASVKKNSGNVLLDFGYLYGIECYNCR